jgi:hypothetical protein
MAMQFELWRLVDVKDETRSTWEFVGTFKTPKRARARIFELAGKNVVFPEEETTWYEDEDGVHTFRIEAVAEGAARDGSPALGDQK